MGLKAIELSPRRVKLAHQFGGGIEIDKVTLSDLPGLGGNHTHCSGSFFFALFRHRFNPISRYMQKYRMNSPDLDVALALPFTIALKHWQCDSFAWQMTHESLVALGSRSRAH